MKKIGLFLGVLVALLTVSCSNILVSGKDGGSVSLVIDGATAQSIRSAGALRSTTGGSTYTLTASIRGDYTATQSVSSSTDGLGSVTFTFERVPVGKSIILDLAATVNGSYIWYGNSGKHTVKRGENQLQIAVGRVSGVLLWDSASVKIAPYGNWDATSSILNPSNPPFWCFDNKGNLYVLNAGYAGMRYDLKADGTYPSTNAPDGNYSNGDSLNAVSYDNVTSILYGITNTHIKKLTTSGSDQIIDFSKEGIIPVGFAVHGGSAYVADQSSEDVNGIPSITIVSFDLTTPDFALGEGDEFKLPTVFGSQPTYQMIYQDGALYLLLSSFTVSSAISESNREVYSCGALVKINPSTLTIDTSFGNNGYLGLVSGRTINGTGYDMDLYSPTESNENSAFYGPVGFVAVMPKKLVIGDAGYKLSNKAGGGLHASRKCRVVTVDLETQAFDVASLSDTTFYGNITNGCGFSGCRIVPCPLPFLSAFRCTVRRGACWTASTVWRLSGGWRLVADGMRPRRR